MQFFITRDFSIQTDLLQFQFEFRSSLTTPQSSRKVGMHRIILPGHIDFHLHQSWLRKTVIEALRWQAKQLISPRIQNIANTANLSFNRVTYKDISSRWGSCSSLRNLNFSIWLLLLPVGFVDYVICHELAHLTEMNHSARFWSEVDRIMGGEVGLAKRVDREMGSYTRQLFQQLRTGR